ncbi:MAG: hypothetical protein J6K48_16240 [Lachnospiraceae bacterium]|nr:hypothetical protein [Lachnospiraceae bacterium]
MKELVKKSRLFQYVRYVRYINIRYGRTHLKGKWVFLIMSLFKVRVYSKDDRFVKLLDEAYLDDNLLYQNKFFYYSIDPFKTTQKINGIIGNMSIDYGKVTDSSLNSLKENCNDKQIEIIDAIRKYANRIAAFLERKGSGDFDMAVQSYYNICDCKAANFQDAIQRILFINQIIWQCGHRLVGLGRLDKVLYPYYRNDLDSGALSEAKVRDMLREFLLTLHYDYWFKGDALSGDTGQIIILGGLNKEKEYEYNELTEIFIDLVKDLNKPDPKILLRVSSKMPRKLMVKALNCVKTGIGSPLFANDDVIIPALVQYGYKKEDACNYVTSACWEPMISGKSSEQNNCQKINYAMPLAEIIKNSYSYKISSYDELKEIYYMNLKEYIHGQVKRIYTRKYQEAPVLSVFTERINKEDISENTAIYNDYGVTTVGLSNVVNSFLVLKKLVWDTNEYTFDAIIKACITDYTGNDLLREKIKSMCNLFWGTDNEEVISLTNEILEKANLFIDQCQNRFSLKIKIGLSSPDYIAEGKKTGATPDGRKKGEPLGVHISSEGGRAYTEIINFASAVNTGGRNINGNVVDLMVSPGFIENNFDKFVDFMMISMEVGYFEMQMNVVSSKVLIDAKRHPEKFPNLIVRVWGFSAYFNELPEEYKDILIERALDNERAA